MSDVHAHALLYASCQTNHVTFNFHKQFPSPTHCVHHPPTIGEYLKLSMRTYVAILVNGYTTCATWAGHTACVAMKEASQ